MQTTVLSNPNEIRCVKNALQKKATQYSLLFGLLIAVLIPLLFAILAVAMFDDSSWFENIGTGFCISVILGIFAAVGLRKFYLKNADRFCSLMANCKLSVENGTVEGILLKAEAVNFNTIFGKQINSERIHLPCRQATPVAVRELETGGISLGLCVEIGRSGMILCVNETDAAHLQEMISQDA